jgi:AcrR family transcriptional regulator
MPLSKTIEKPSVRKRVHSAPQRREEILDAATELFAQDGYSDGVTQALVERLQVGKGTLYRHFPSKRALFLAAVDRVMRRLREYIDASIAGVDDPLDRVTTAVHAFLTFFAEHPRFVELLVQERALFKDRQTPTYLQHRERNAARWRELFAALIAAGRVRNIPVERITNVISDLSYGTIFTNYFAGRNKPPGEQARDILDIVFLGIVCGPERVRRSAAESCLARVAAPSARSAKSSGSPVERRSGGSSPT